VLTASSKACSWFESIKLITTGIGTARFFWVRFAVLEPKQYLYRSITCRIYCTPKALWRLNWFLRDFGYDTDLLGRDEVDEKALLRFGARRIREPLWPSAGASKRP
jgi:hypothetical protein